MTNVLIAILVVLLLILAVIVGAFLWIRAKLKGFFKSISDAVGDLAEMAKSMAAMPDFRLDLQPMTLGDWFHQPQVEAWSNELRELGFEEAGDYQVGEGENMKVRGFVHEEDSVAAVIYDMEAATHFEMVCMYDNGDVFMVTSTPESGFRKPPFKKAIYLTAPGVDELHDRLMAERPTDGLSEIAAVDFRYHATNTYAREMNWRVDTGGYTDDEIRSVAGSDDDGDVNDMAKMMMQAGLSGEASTFVLEKYRDQFDPAVVPEGADDHQFAVILNMTEADDLCSHLPDVEMEDDDWEKREAYAEGLIKDVGSRAAFAKLLEDNARGGEVRKLMSVSDPVEADIYLLPMDVEEEYE